MIQNIILAAALVAGQVAASSAAVLVTFAEDSTGVTGNLTGSIDLTGGTSVGGLSSPAFINTDGEIGWGAGSGGGSFFFGAAFINPAAETFGFGPTSDFTEATSSTGDVFYFDKNFLGVPAGYVSGDPLLSSVFFASATFASLGVTPGTYVYTLGNGDTISISFGTAAPVPLPAALPLMLAGLGTLALLRRRKT